MSENAELIKLDPYTGLKLDDRPVRIDFRDEATETIYNDVSYEEAVIAEGARRHAISLKEVLPFRNKYARKCVVKSKELIKEGDEIDAIGFYADEYVPEHFTDSDEYVSYFMTINGKNYKLNPINYPGLGERIIKSVPSPNPPTENYSIYVGEKIKSAMLSIVIKTPNDYETPYVSNIKIVKR